MIEGAIIKLLAKRVPNYHLVSPKYGRDTYSLCTCPKCKHSKIRAPEGDSVKGKRFCGLVLRHLIALGQPEGHALVAENGTCDASVFEKEDYTDFSLQSEGRGENDAENA